MTQRKIEVDFDVIDKALDRIADLERAVTDIGEVTIHHSDAIAKLIEFMEVARVAIERLQALAVRELPPANQAVN